MYTLEKASKHQHPVLLQIWEASVRATHLFLQPGDIDFFKQTIIDHKVFEQTDITIVKNSDDAILGFIGVSGVFLDMLFIDPVVRGSGIGKLLLLHAVNELGITRVDVNEQNENTLQFYQHFGFKIMSRDELDGTGKPYPILHLGL